MGREPGEVKRDDDVAIRVYTYYASVLRASDRPNRCRRCRWIRSIRDVFQGCCEVRRRHDGHGKNQPQAFREDQNKRARPWNSAIRRSQAQTRLNKKLALQGTTLNDLTGKMAKWVAGSHGGLMIGAESQTLSPSGTKRGWKLPATGCVTSIRTTPVLPYCPKQLKSHPLPLHRRSFAFAVAVPPRASLCCLSLTRLAIAAHARYHCPTTLPRRLHPSFLPLPLDAPSLPQQQHDVGKAGTTASAWRPRQCIRPRLAAPTPPVSSPT